MHELAAVLEPSHANEPSGQRALGELLHGKDRVLHVRYVLKQGVTVGLYQLAEMRPGSPLFF